MASVDPERYEVEGAHELTHGVVVIQVAHPSTVLSRRSPMRVVTAEPDADLERLVVDRNLWSGT